MVWSTSLYAAFVCKAKIGCRVPGLFALLEGADLSSGCSGWNRTSKLILHRLLWHCRALICCQCDEDPGPVPLSKTEALICQTFHVPPPPFPFTWLHGKGQRGQRCLYAPMIAVLTVVRLCAASWCSFLCKMGVLFSQILMSCENNLGAAMASITGAQVWKEKPLKWKLGVYN